MAFRIAVGVGPENPGAEKIESIEGVSSVKQLLKGFIVNVSDDVDLNVVIKEIERHGTSIILVQESLM